MGMLDTARRILNNLASLDQWFDEGSRERLLSGATRRDYYLGAHRRNLRVKPNQTDDNLTLNFSGLIVDRGVSMLLGQGIAFDLPGDPVIVANPETGEEEQVDPDNQRYIDAVWEANKRDILLQKTAQFGGTDGTCYLKILPDYYESEEYETLPRLVALDPLYLSIDTDPEDIDEVVRYTNSFVIRRGDQEVSRREIVERVMVTVDAEGEQTIEAGKIAGFVQAGWEIQQWENSISTGGHWQMTSKEIWDYPFPPIVHWQNLPLAGSVYGRPDLSEDVIAVNDRINREASNISKIVRLHAHPKTWGRGFNALSPGVKWGADEMVMIPGEHGMIANLEMQSEMAGYLAWFSVLRQAIFDLARTVDLASMQDKLGALTNFGLRVLFFDSLAKLDSKRELYGEALSDLNHRLLVLWDAPGIDTGGGAVVWPEALPTSESEQITALQADMNQGLLSKETAAGIRGYDWRKEQERIQAEQEGQDSIGARLLSAFERGQ